ncbi:hypothetical protein N9748_00790, partial [bacterium]|nr:hypothetical protein [bacterium]
AFSGSTTRQITAVITRWRSAVMSTNPLDMETSPLELASLPPPEEDGQTSERTLAIEPGFFDGKNLGLVKPPIAPGDEPVSQVEQPHDPKQVAGMGKAIQGINAARKILKEYEKKGEVDEAGELIPFKRSTPQKSPLKDMPGTEPKDTTDNRSRVRRKRITSSFSSSL